mgnify:CR=1 FL=1
MGEDYLRYTPSEGEKKMIEVKKYQLLKKENCDDGYRREVYAMDLNKVFNFIYHRPKALWCMGEIGEETRRHYKIPREFNHWVFLKYKNEKN